MKPLRNTTTGYLLTALAVAAFLLASQPARASVFLFTLSPPNSFAAPGDSGAFEVDLKNTGSDPELIGAFRFGLTTDIAGIAFDNVTTGTLLAPYIFAAPSVGSWHGPNIATTLNPVAVMDQDNSSSMTLAAGATAGLGYVTYHVNSNATPGSVIISFAPLSGFSGDCPLGLCEYLNIDTRLNVPGYALDVANLVGGTLTVTTGETTGDTPEPNVLLPTGLLLVGLGAFWRRQARIGKERIAG